MPAKDLGSKYVCFKCSTKFYDLRKPDPICPKCGADQREAQAAKPASEGRRGRLAAVPKAPLPLPEPEAAAEAEDELEAIPDAEEEEELEDEEP